jgi:hypothetical protein
MYLLNYFFEYVLLISIQLVNYFIFFPSNFQAEEERATEGGDFGVGEGPHLYHRLGQQDLRSPHPGVHEVSIYIRTCTYIWDVILII